MILALIRYIVHDFIIRCILLHKPYVIFYNIIIEVSTFSFKKYIFLKNMAIYF